MATPLRTQLLAVLFSMVMQTQLFTTVLCMKLVEQELMTLDEPIGNFLPTIEHVNPAITIRQLMQHTSGLDEIPQFGANVVGNPDKAWTYDDILSLLKAPVFEPGTDFHFSVINYILLAMITENIAGKTYVELIHEIITVPLKLKNTYLEGFDQIPANRPHPWWDNQDRGDESRVALGTAFRSLAAIVSTPSDMTKFYDAVFNNNFLSNESLSQITNFNVNTDYGPKGLGGLGIEYFNGQQYWFYETGGIGYSAMMIYSPTCRNVLCLSSNAFEETEFKKIMKFGWEMSDGLCGK